MPIGFFGALVLMGSKLAAQEAPQSPAVAPSSAPSPGVPTAPSARAPSASATPSARPAPTAPSPSASAPSASTTPSPSVGAPSPSAPSPSELDAAPAVPQSAAPAKPLALEPRAAESAPLGAASNSVPPGGSPAVAPYSPELAPSAPGTPPQLGAPGRQRAAVPAPWSWTKALPPAEPSRDSDETPIDQSVNPRVVWRGTALQTTHSATTSALGVGSDYQSAMHQVYTQNYGLLLNYFVLDDKAFRLRVTLRPSFDVELTDSGQTTTEREPVFADLPVTVAGVLPLVRNKEKMLATILASNLTTTFPTSKFSGGNIIRLSPRATLIQSLPIFGKDAPLLKSFSVGVAGRYDAQFSRANVAVSDYVLSRERQTYDAGGVGSNSDVLSGARLAPHTFRVSAFMAFNEEVGSTQLQLSLGANYSSARLHDVSTTQRELLTGPIDVPPQGRSSRPTGGFGVGLSVLPITELAFSLGYNNSTDLGGPSPNIIYAPRAQFLAGMSVNLDAIYEGMTGPRRTVPFVMF